MSEEERSTAVVPPSLRDLVVADEPAEDSLIGATLHDTYSVTRFLAEGGMGRVYEAQHTRITTKRFAIKVLHAALKHSMDVRMRFRREAEAAAAVDHPNVLGVHDFGYTPDGRPYLVSDFLVGKELYALLDRGAPLAVGFATNIACQMCRALDAAHEKGVIHRDLKPANVFLVGPKDAPDVRVLDFGLSKILELADATDTQTGTVMGTPSYMSPEQAKGERADHRADIYGVGAVLYACLTGRPPFEEDSPHQTVLAVMTREPVRPCLVNPSIPPELEVVVQKAMAHKPADRYATMGDLEAALRPFAREPALRRGSLPAVPSPLPLKTSNGAGAAEARGVRRRAIAWIVLAALLLLASGLSAAIGAFPLISSGRLRGTVLLLISLAIAGSLFTPCLLLVLFLRRRYWNNSARMISLVEGLRAPIIAACAVYGLAALLGRVLDAGSLYVRDIAAPPNASGWSGWAPFLFGLGLLAAIATALRRRILATSHTALRRVAAGPVLIGLVTAASVTMLAFGYRMSAQQSRGLAETASVPELAQEPEPTVATGASVPSTSAPPGSIETTAHPTEPPVDRAPDVDLQAAIASGTPALTELQGKFPKDPRVLKPLALALGKEKNRASEMLRVLDSLFVVAPDEAADAQIYGLVRTAALVPATSQRALDMAKTTMGQMGADLLFDLVQNESMIAGRARPLLETAEVQRNLSPALEVAYELFIAPTCAARLALLPKVIRDGDTRSLTILTQVTARTAHNCGPRRNRWCPALCDKDTPQFESAMKQVQDRLAGAAPAPPP